MTIEGKIGQSGVILRNVFDADWFMRAMDSYLRCSPLDRIALDLMLTQSGYRYTLDQERQAGPHAGRCNARAFSAREGSVRALRRDFGACAALPGLRPWQKVLGLMRETQIGRTVAAGQTAQGVTFCAAISRPPIAA